VTGNEIEESTKLQEFFLPGPPDANNSNKLDITNIDLDFEVFLKNEF
jgi:hypothetical protein